MIDAIINAAVQRVRDIQGVDKPLGYAILRAEPYDGQIAETQIADLLVKTPAVFVAVETAKPVLDRSRYRWATTVNLLVVTRNLASGRAAALGGPAGAPSVGAYLLAELLAVAFTGELLGFDKKDFDPIEPGEIRTIVPGWARDQKAALVGVSLATAFYTPAKPLVGHEAELVDFLRVQSRLAIGDAADPYTDLSETRSQSNG